MSRHVELVESAFDPLMCLAAFSGGLEDEGAIVSFTGRARGASRDGHLVQALMLEKYRGVTLSSMQAIVDDACRRFRITRCHVVHRAGRVLPGEPIVFVATASPHRRSAFEATDYLMDRLKTDAVFWKREEHAGGFAWIEPTARDRSDQARWLQCDSEETCPESMKA